jgi:aerotaxis receptor
LSEGGLAMRTNLPVTQREYKLADNAILMSTTDPKSHITYANAAFVDVSGFSREELLAQPHNLVRHPDMPPHAFADMWATLRAGQPWTALVKNRRKNGDHYWVRANATPVMRQGNPVGYMSVRCKASDQEIQAAEKLYAQFRAGQEGSQAFHKGVIVRTGWMKWASIRQTLPVRWRIRAAVFAASAASVIGSVGAGLAGTGLLAAAAIGLAGAALTSWWLEAQVSRPLEKVLDLALHVASGQSQSVAHMDRVDEIGMTLRVVNQLGLMFRWLVDDVSEQVANVQVASDEIALGNNDLASRTEQAATSVQQTAASMTEMTATVRSNADNARQVTQLASSASQAAAKGGSTMHDMVSMMSGITENSRRIADIIGVIDSIAFQTNILALNAAVEAARAGDQGRGFAVVAGEVRNLAQRSAQAAKEIKSLISTSVERVESGGRLVESAGKTMDDIVAQVCRVTDLVGEISVATDQQSSGIGQVGDAVSHLDQITQQNAALVEQSASASESLKDQALRLVEAISVFKMVRTTEPRKAA